MKELAEAKRLLAQQKKKGAELSEIEYQKQFLIRNKIAQLFMLMKTLGYESVKNERGDTILDTTETNVSEITAR